MKYMSFGISPEQAQYLKNRKFQTNEIARILRLPPHTVGDLVKSSFSNIRQQSLEIIHRSLLLPDKKAQYFTKFNLKSLLRGDYQSHMKEYAIVCQND